MLNSAEVAAANRFGLGARPAEVAAIGRDPRDWLRQQVIGLGPLPPELDGFPSGVAQAALLLEMRRSKGDGGEQQLLKTRWRQSFAEECAARIKAATTTNLPFRERLVHFWSNHFTVSAQRPVVAGFAGSFEREAIRPYVTGRFADMLIAMARHQAMLFYLDNALSIGPDSRASRGKRGLNENFAREVMELHTMGVGSGYTQADITALAKILTGWSIVRNDREGQPGAFRFYPLAHQPGSKLFLGRQIAEGGVDEGEGALRLIATHPATHRFLATKLARHFVADDPPASAINRLSDVLAETGGDLRQVSLALVDLPEAWAQSNSKVRTPTEFLAAAVRTTSMTVTPGNLLAVLRQFGQAPFTAPSPAGWPDEARAWIGPEAMLMRVKWALAAAHRIPPSADPIQLAGLALGGGASPATLQAVSQAPDRIEAVATLLASPDFQRR